MNEEKVLSTKIIASQDSLSWKKGIISRPFCHYRNSLGVSLRSASGKETRFRHRLTQIKIPGMSQTEVNILACTGSIIITAKTLINSVTVKQATFDFIDPNSHSQDIDNGGKTLLSRTN